jgi:hypothetical protein
VTNVKKQFETHVKSLKFDFIKKYPQLQRARFRPGAKPLNPAWGYATRPSIQDLPTNPLLLNENISICETLAFYATKL